MVIVSMLVAHSHNSGQYLSTGGGGKNEESYITAQRGLITSLPLDCEPWRMHTAIAELDAMAGTATSTTKQIQKHILHAIINPDTLKSHEMSVMDWQKAWDEYEVEFGLQNQPFIEATQRYKGQRKHKHRLYLRVDTETGKAIDMPYSKIRNSKVSRTLEYDLKHDFVHSPHDRTVLRRLLKEGRRDVAKWMMLTHKAHKLAPNKAKKTQNEYEQERRTKWSMEWVKRDVKEAYQLADGTKSFQAALREKNYDLAIGKRGVVVVHPVGGSYGLNRSLGIKGKDARAYQEKLKKELDLKEVKTMKEERKQTPIDPEKLKADQQRLFRWQGKLNDIQRKLDQQEEALGKREKLLQKKEYDLNYRQQKFSEEREEFSKLRNGFQQRKKDLSRREEALSKRAKERAGELAPKKQQRQDSSPAYKNTPNIPAQFKQLMYEESKRLKEEKASEKNSVEAKFFARISEALADKSGRKLMELAREFRKEDFLRNGQDMTQKKDSVQQKNSSKPSVKVKEKSFSDFFPQARVQKDFSSLRFKQAFARQQFDAEIFAFEEETSKLLDKYEGSTEKQTKDRIRGTIDEYKGVLQQRAAPIEDQFRAARTQVLSCQQYLYRQFLRADENAVSRFFFGLKNGVSLARMPKYLLSASTRANFFEKRFNRELRRLKKPYQKQVDRIAKGLRKHLRQDIRKLRQEHRQQVKQLPKIGVDVRQQKKALIQKFENMQATQVRNFERKHQGQDLAKLKSGKKQLIPAQQQAHNILKNLREKSEQRLNLAVKPADKLNTPKSNNVIRLDRQFRQRLRP